MKMFGKILFLASVLFLSAEPSLAMSRKKLATQVYCQAHMPYQQKSGIIVHRLWHSPKLSIFGDRPALRHSFQKGTAENCFTEGARDISESTCGQCNDKLWDEEREDLFLNKEKPVDDEKGSIKQ